MISLDALFAGIEMAGIEAATTSITRGADMIRDRAKELAPVRKIFKGQNKHYSIRAKSIGEIEGDRAIRQRLGLGPENMHIMPPTIVVTRAPQILGLRTVARSGAVMASAVAQNRLDRRGRYELHVGRAIHSLKANGTGGQLGGRLRKEIYAIAAKIEGKTIFARVVSPTPYAKFQEFGTRHNPAHPFLRPAGHESAGTIKADVLSSVTSAAHRASQGTFRVATISVKLKAG
jgi:HK97 gp10 family phage protein